MKKITIFDYYLALSQKRYKINVLDGMGPDRTGPAIETDRELIPGRGQAIDKTRSPYFLHSCPMPYIAKRISTFLWQSFI